MKNSGKNANLPSTYLGVTYSVRIGGIELMIPNANPWHNLKIIRAINDLMYISSPKTIASRFPISKHHLNNRKKLPS